MPQAELFLREAVKDQKRESANLAQYLVAAVFDKETWQKIVKDVYEE
jgi:hypothetical protein